MRQLLVEVPQGQGERAMAIAQEHEAVNLACTKATGADGALDLVVAHVSNHRVGGLIEELQSLPDLRVTVGHQGVYTLHPPREEVPDQVVRVGPRSPIEVYLGALQSIGSWQGLLGYAVASSVVVWIGMFTNTIYLLIAAMLIAPYAGPAMVVAVGTARGDWALLGRGLVRYFAGLATAVAGAALLSFLLGQRIATEQMVSVSQVSSLTALLPLVAGAAGALNVIQSERNSLVSGAAVGVLVAAALAPPAGLIGMALPLARWDLALSGVFVLLLQLVGINLSGSLVFRFFGLTPQGPRYGRGTESTFYAGLAASALALVGLLAWQFADAPQFQRDSLSRRAAAEAQRAVDESGLAEVVEVNVRFTRARISDQHSLLGVVYVQPRSDVDVPREEIRSRLVRAVQDRLLDRGFPVTPLIDVNVLTPPGRQPAGVQAP